MYLLEINLALCSLYALILDSLKIGYKHKRIIYYVLAGIQIFMLRTFAEISSLPDLENYESLFEITREYTFKDVLYGKLIFVAEYGYMLLMKICSWITPNFTFALGIISLIWIIGYYKFFEHYSPYIAVPVLLLLVTEFPQSLFVLRQHLAIAIWLFAYPYIIKRDFIRFLLVGGLAISMHSTAIIFLPVYFLYGVFNKNTWLINSIILAVGCVILFSALEGINDYAELSYGNYITGEKAGNSNLTNAYKYSLYFLSYVFFLRDKIFQDGIYKLLTISIIMGIILSFFGTSFSLTGRLIRYFTPACMLLIPIVMIHIKNPCIRYGYFGTILLLNAISIFVESSREFICNYRLIF